MEKPQVSPKNVLTVDYTNSPDLKALLDGKTPGDSCELKLKLMVISKTPQEIKFSIEKVITEDNYDTDDTEAEPSDKEPIMMRMRGKSKGDMPMGKPHNRPAQRVENPTQPYPASFA